MQISKSPLVFDPAARQIVGNDVWTTCAPKKWWCVVTSDNAGGARGWVNSIYYQTSHSLQNAVDALNARGTGWTIYNEQFLVCETVRNPYTGLAIASRGQSWLFGATQSTDFTPYFRKDWNFGHQNQFSKARWLNWHHYGNMLNYCTARCGHAQHVEVSPKADWPASRPIMPGITEPFTCPQMPLINLP